MDMQEFLKNDGEWLKGGGPKAEIALSTRVRLARNLANRRFPTHPDQSERREILDEIRDAFQLVEGDRNFTWHELDGQLPLDRRILMERHLISRELADGSGPRAVAFDQGETITIMVNEEDHLRMQSMRSGLRLREAYDSLNELDDELSAHLHFAFDPVYGYLTSCPTNVGTGLRASVMLHLPGLVMTQHIEKVFRALYEMRMTVRGFYGEGTEASGELYQISNQVTCGRTEHDILDDMEAAINSIIAYEEQARQELLANDRPRLEDRVWRSWGTLNNARLMSSDEAMRHLSSLRMGVVMGLLSDSLKLEELQRLFLFSQPAHLQRLEGRELGSSDRDLVRAEFLRKCLNPEAN